ncbi:hypothetical protein [Acidihalobacter prosperus]|uniref:hypothetical protein n=1 Tax=Acidihalobacter prosperus TaxID=160660 RepID=UPI00050766A9|nr:hypothetical protein [Acidihalobacter prosperus]
MDNFEREDRIEALAERSTHVENVLRHAFLAELASHVWMEDPRERLTILTAEVDDSGCDLIIERDVMVRRIQLKQAHDEKKPRKFSVRVEFAMYPGACIVVVHHSLRDIKPTSYSFYGQGLDQEMPYIEAHRTTVSAGRRTASGERIPRLRYRDALFSKFKQNLSMAQLMIELFPNDQPRPL